MMVIIGKGKNRDASELPIDRAFSNPDLAFWKVLDNGGWVARNFPMSG